MHCASAATAKKPAPTARRIAKWQALRLCEQDPEGVEDLRLHAMQLDEFRGARKKKKLRRAYLPELHDLPKRPIAGAVELAEYVAAAVDDWGRASGLMVPASALAPHLHCSPAQVPRAVAWLVRRHALQVVELFDHHPEGFETRSGDRVKHPQVANLYSPGPALLDMLEKRRQWRAKGSKKRVVSVGVQGSENLRSGRSCFSSLSVLSEHPSKKNNNPRERTNTAAVDKRPPFAHWDRIARAEEAEIRKERSLRARNRSQKARGLTREGAAALAAVPNASSVALARPVDARSETGQGAATPDSIVAPSASQRVAPPADPIVDLCRGVLGELLSKRLDTDQVAAKMTALEQLAAISEPEAAPSVRPRRPRRAGKRPRRKPGKRWSAIRPGQNARPYSPSPDAPAVVEPGSSKRRDQSAPVSMADLLPRGLDGETFVEPRNLETSKEGKRDRPSDAVPHEVMQYFETALRRSPPARRATLEALANRLCELTRAGEISTSELASQLQAQARLFCPDLPALALSSDPPCPVDVGRNLPSCGQTVAGLVGRGAPAFLRFARAGEFREALEKRDRIADFHRMRNATRMEVLRADELGDDETTPEPLDEDA